MSAFQSILKAGIALQIQNEFDPKDVLKLANKMFKGPTDADRLMAIGKFVGSTNSKDRVFFGDGLSSVAPSFDVVPIADVKPYKASAAGKFISSLSNEQAVLFSSLTETLNANQKQIINNGSSATASINERQNATEQMVATFTATQDGIAKKLLASLSSAQKESLSVLTGFLPK